MRQPYARSATERNFSAKASSRKPSVTLTTFIQPPDLGMDFSHEGKRAKSVKGKAKAMAKPSIPRAGPTMLPVVDTSTNRKPIMGPVHEKLTNESVKAIRKMLISPVVRSALLSTALLHLAGSVISKAPKKEAANTTSSRQKKMLNTALVERAFSALAPKMAVMTSPSVT